MPMFRLFIFTVLLTGISIAAIGQQHRMHYFTSYNNMSERQQYVAQKTFFGLTYPTMVLASQNHYVGSGDTTFSVNARNGFGIGFINGAYYNLGEFRNGKSIMALEIAVNINAYFWKFKVDEFGVGNTRKANHTNFGLPITLMYKRGAEAILSTEGKFMYSLGVGLHPAYTSTNYFEKSIDKWQLNPLIMAELGVFAGRAMKLRATYYPLPKVIYNSTFDYAGSKITSKITGSSGLVVSLLFMFNSHHWGS
jgi:hypothetical protein